MRTLRLLLLCVGLGALGCASSDASPLSEEESAEYLDDGKADGTSGLLTTAMVDGATTRIFAALTRVPDSATSKRLVAASKRNVAVELYLVQKEAANAATVIAAQHLEASGVHTLVVRENQCEYAAVVDDQVTTVDSDRRIHRSKNKDKLAKALEAFAGVLHPQLTIEPRTIASESLRWWRQPDDTGAGIVGLIAGASSSIDLEIYQVEHPAVVDALVAAAGRNVKVRVMLEPKTVGAVNYTAVSNSLIAGGVEVQPTPPAFDSSHNVDHAKFFVFDSSGLAFGSGNLVCSGLGGNPAQEFNTLDYWIEDGRPAAVEEARKLFEADWNRQSTTSLEFTHLVVTPDNALTKILELIDSAATKLYVYNQSLNDATILEHLVAAKGKGVDVRVLLGLQPGYGGDPPANQAALDTLSQAGIPAALFSRHYLHTKVIVTDDRAFLGSQNFTSGGLKNNRELGEISNDPALVKALEEDFLADEKNPEP